MKYLIYLALVFTVYNCDKTTNTSKIDELYNESRFNYLHKGTNSARIIIELNNLKLKSVADSSKASIIKGRDFMLSDEYEKSIEEYKLAITYLKKAPIDSLFIRAYIGISSPYNQLGRFDEALFFLYEAEKIAEEIKSEKDLGICYDAISQIMQTKGDLQTAKQFLYKSIPLIKNNESNYYNTQLTLANIFGMNNQIDSALIIDNDNLKKLVGKNKSIYESYFYNNKANCYLFTNQFDSAEVYMKKCLAIDLSTNVKKQIADTYSGLMSLYAITNDSVKLNEISKKALSYSNSINYFMGKQMVFESLSNYHAHKKNYKLALAYKDSLFINYKNGLNEKTENKIAQLKIQFDFDKKEQLIQKNKEEIILQRIIISVIILLIVSLSLFFISFYKQSKRKKQEAIFKAEQQQKDIANKTIFEAEQKERTRIARDLHDSIGQMLAYIKMQSNQTEDSTFTKAIDKTILEVRNISHELMPPELNFGLQKAIESLIHDTKLKAEILSNDEFSRFNFSDVFSISLYRIIQELINNTIKHANASEIYFTIDKIETEITIHFFTNGKEISEENLKNSSGIGWQNIKARLLLLNGSIKIDNNTHKNGFILMLHLPNATNKN